MKPKNIVKISIVGVVTILVAAILVRMFTLSTDITLVKTIKTPDLSEISEMFSGDYRQKAIALDGRVIQGTSMEPQPIASTAKMILSLAIMREKPFNLGSQGESITITPEFFNRYLWYVAHNGSNTRVLVGEQISQYDALASVLLASSNNMADTLAIWAFDSLESYQNYATNMLQEMGITNTTIGADASGYDESTTSTAEDLVRIASELLKNPVLKEIVGLKSHVVPVANEIQNTNKILGNSLNNGSTVIGVKTGYIGDISGYNLVSAYEIDGHIVTLALLGANTRSDSFEGSENELLKLSQEIIPTIIANKDEKVGYLETWWSGQHEIYADEELKVIGVKSDELQIDLLDSGLTATLNGEASNTKTHHEAFPKSPTIWERFLHVFGWRHE